MRMPVIMPMPYGTSRTGELDFEERRYRQMGCHCHSTYRLRPHGIEHCPLERVRFHRRNISLVCRRLDVERPRNHGGSRWRIYCNYWWLPKFVVVAIRKVFATVFRVLLFQWVRCRKTLLRNSIGILGEWFAANRPKIVNVTDVSINFFASVIHNAHEVRLMWRTVN